MAEQKITLIIDEDGAISAKTQGFAGNTCLDALDEIMDVQPVTSIRTTDEFNQNVVRNVAKKVTQGRS
ncbi:DUF2997 domain-containing protein [Moritella dasanensis]|jgi:hypothetical protein|uniref:DUF2997 domain-containing protein n=1 Tax=Moritella dasanensis TaxID=428031 RepID=UPI00030E7993|nr:DUF2997 domain-containing protein [Moritella dasanensis]